MDLPTYTSIWRIEKRLYKLYDFRLPMPLPIGQITVFAAIAVPYVVLLTLLGLPFSHNLIWLYVLPPGVATWLFTRPVLESKRLPELIRSQLRYLAEPRVWCRMAPLAESDVVLVTGRVWRLSPAARERLDEAAAVPAPSARPARGARSARPRRLARPPARPRTQQSRSQQPRTERQPARSRAPRSAEPVARDNAGVFGRPAAQALTGLLAPPPAGAGVAVRQPSVQRPRPDRPLPGRPVPEHGTLNRPVSQPRPMRAPTAPPTRPVSPQPQPSVSLQASTAPTPSPQPVLSQPVLSQPVSQPLLPLPSASVPPSAPGAEVRQVPASPRPEPGPAAPRPEPSVAAEPPAEHRQGRPVVTVVGQGVPQERPPTVEHALAGPSARRGDGRSGKVTVVPGGHRPGKPDQLQRDRSRAQLPIEGQRRIVVLGCTVGAGQTITALLVGEVLASLRTDQVAVLDLNPGNDSLAQRAMLRPALSQAASLGPSRLTVLTANDETVDPAEPIDPVVAARAFEQASARHQLVLADPSTAAVPRMLAVADQLVLVAPASATASQAIGMTFEWLGAHGQGDLADGAIMVMNGVSRRSTEHVEQAERVCRGQCRAIVRVPWDDQLGAHTARRIPVAAQAAPATQQWAGLLSQATAGAYTAMAGVLVAALTGPGAGRALR